MYTAIDGSLSIHRLGATQKKGSKSHSDGLKKRLPSNDTLWIDINSYFSQLKFEIHAALKASCSGKEFPRLT